MILGAPSETSAYGVLAPAPLGETDVVGIDGARTPLSTLLSPFYLRRVDLRVYTDGFEPACRVKGRVGRAELGAGFAVEGFQLDELPFGQEVKVEVADLSEARGDALTVRVETFLRGRDPKRRTKAWKRGEARARLADAPKRTPHEVPVDLLERLFDRNVPPAWLEGAATMACAEERATHHGALGRRDGRLHLLGDGSDAAPLRSILHDMAAPAFVGEGERHTRTIVLWWRGGA